MIDPRHFRELVIRPTLQNLGLWSPAAENLLLGTAIQESGLVYLKQIGGGPALGVYQIEPATHDDVWRNYLAFRQDLKRRAMDVSTNRWSGTPQLVTNLAYATAIARIIYRRVPEPLPPPGDIEGMGAYWKQYFNTPAGRGTAAQFILNYREHAK